jgi:hypothetical protein
LAPNLEVTMWQRWLMGLAALMLILVCRAAGDAKPEPRGWFILRWMEKPNPKGPSTKAAAADVVAFTRVLEYDRASGEAPFAALQPQLREGDLVAYYLPANQARKEILQGDVNKIGYRLLKYGHLAIVVADPARQGELRLFSSQSFKGPNTDEALATLREHCFHVYRLDQWQRVNVSRLREFVTLAHAKAGNWMGYDFSGMFGLWNSNLKPDQPKKIGHDYICSSVVAAALYYAGVELDAVQRGGIGDLVSPQQVVSSKGRLIATPAIELVAETVAAKP